MAEIHNTIHKIQIVPANGNMPFYLTSPYNYTPQFLTYILFVINVLYTTILISYFQQTTISQSIPQWQQL